jgi:hypothetical protein
VDSLDEFYYPSMPNWKWRRRRESEGPPPLDYPDASAKYGIQQFDNVRVVATPETESRGFAGRTASCHGFTMPSITSHGLDAIGSTDADLVFNLYFEDTEEDAWFAPDLVEFVDHGPGLTIEIADKKFIRTADGGWMDQDTGEIAT